MPGELRSRLEWVQAFTRVHCAAVASQAEQWVWGVSWDIWAVVCVVDYREMKDVKLVEEKKGSLYARP